MPRLRATMTFEYDAEDGDYEGATTPAEMAAIDFENIKGDPWLFAEMAAGYPAQVTVEPVETP